MRMCPASGVISNRFFYYALVTGVYMKKSTLVIRASHLTNRPMDFATVVKWSYATDERHDKCQTSSRAVPQYFGSWFSVDFLSTSKTRY
jgi:hypothetical protein